MSRTSAAMRQYSTLRVWYTLGIATIIVMLIFIAYIIAKGDVEPQATNPLEILNPDGSKVTEPLPGSTIIQMKPFQVQDYLKDNPETLLLDVRTRAEYDLGHIEGATSLPLNDLSSAALGTLDPNTPIILTCQSGNTRSMRAANWLAEHGYTNVYNLDGGMSAWVASALPVCTAELCPE